MTKVLHRVLLTLISCLVLYITSSGQDLTIPDEKVTVKGTVTDRTGNRVPRPYITVDRKGQRCRFQANSLGAFKIQVPPGMYVFTVEADGLVPSTFTNVLLQPGKDSEQKFSLDVIRCYDCYGLIARSRPPAFYEYDDPDIKPPVIIERPEPEYPEIAKERNIEGRVVLRVLLNPSGSVTRIVPLESLPYGLTESAVKAARALTFQVARYENRPVSSSFKLTYEFSRHNAECRLISK